MKARADSEDRGSRFSLHPLLWLVGNAALVTRARAGQADADRSAPGGIGCLVS